jgi:hypothetical protein
MSDHRVTFFVERGALGAVCSCDQWEQTVGRVDEMAGLDPVMLLGRLIIQAVEHTKASADE